MRLRPLIDYTTQNVPKTASKRVSFRVANIGMNEEGEEDRVPPTEPRGTKRRIPVSPSSSSSSLNSEVQPGAGEVPVVPGTNPENAIDLDSDDEEAAEEAAETEEEASAPEEEAVEYQAPSPSPPTSQWFSITSVDWKKNASVGQVAIFNILTKGKKYVVADPACDVGHTFFKNVEYKADLPYVANPDALHRVGEVRLYTAERLDDDDAQLPEAHDVVEFSKTHHFPQPDEQQRYVLAAVWLGPGDHSVQTNTLMLCMLGITTIDATKVDTASDPSHFISCAEELLSICPWFQLHDEPCCAIETLRNTTSWKRREWFAVEVENWKNADDLDPSPTLRPSKILAGVVMRAYNNNDIKLLNADPTAGSTNTYGPYSVIPLFDEVDTLFIRQLEYPNRIVEVRVYVANFRDTLDNEVLFFQNNFAGFETFDRNDEHLLLAALHFGSIDENFVTQVALGVIKCQNSLDWRGHELVAYELIKSCPWNGVATSFKKTLVMEKEEEGHFDPEIAMLLLEHDDDASEEEGGLTMEDAEILLLADSD